MGVVTVERALSDDLQPRRSSEMAAGERELWRLHGPAKVAVAVLNVRPPLSELRVFYEPESLNDVLTREFGNDRALLTHANFVRDELLKQGWVALGPSGAARRPSPITARRVTTGVSIITALAAIWSWRRTRRTPRPRVDDRPNTVDAGS